MNGVLRAVALADFAPHMLYVTNKDKPGFIGRFGMTLADAGVNIATFHLGRAAQGEDAICLVSTDGDTLDEVRCARCRW
jgi:D-3-phosphoglycerate dehydrogenase